MAKPVTRLLFTLPLVACGAADAASPAPKARPADVEMAAAAPPPPPASAAPPEATPPAQSSVPEVVKRHLVVEQTFAAGKWPEGLAVVGDVAWVAESGSRRVLRIPLVAGSGGVTAVPVGRLPVDVVAVDAKVYTLAETDRTVYEIDPKTKSARAFTTLADCPQGLAAGGGALWVLLWSKCSSAGSSVVRVDLAKRTQKATVPMGSGAWSITHARGQAWVAYADDTVRAVDETTLAVTDLPGPTRTPSNARVIAAGPKGIYASHWDTVVAMDPAGHEPRSVKLPERVAALVADDVGVAVALESGRILVLDPTTGATLEDLASPGSITRPHALVRYGNRYLVTEHGAHGEHGQLRVLGVAP